ncbi:MmcQ/YjbR family DNA-binding protein [Leucobacter ruminantium]|uniref:MmcQ/YjbR family DNA-binding protein n=1 Tax=Leucobacter ruminantium TaxID=1289170 RepID=A0A939LX53_9MICO|nr:MmcQ/YjbR family DNA-binding protein [Leucobacter ruminantium]MBO1806066.1 MmcQ/YjbR family DNA-binding protein [Leucobacter ruminantium]
MATFDDVRAIALALPETEEREGGWNMGPSWRVVGGPMFAWSRPVTGKDLAWMRERGEEPGEPVLAIRVDGEEAKLELLEAFPEIAFTIPHLDGYPAVLLRLPLIEAGLLGELIIDSWLLRARKRTARAWLAEHGFAEG